MTSISGQKIISGSEKNPVFNARSLGPTQAEQQIEITLRLRPAKTPAPQMDTADAQSLNRQFMTREEFAKNYGASASDIAKIKNFAKQKNLIVLDANAAQRRVVLSGTASALDKAFGTKLEEYEHDNGTYRGRTGHLTAPDDVADIIEGVFGLDDRAQAKLKFKMIDRTGFAQAHVNGRSFTPPELAKLYNFPQDLDGSGQCIGIIELGGGSRSADINAYFNGLHLPAPQVKIISVDHAKNRPSGPNGADGEVMLDIEVAGAIASKAKIVVYFAPNTDRGFLDAITAAVHDAVNKPSVISISWGAAEKHWTRQAMNAFESVFIDAAAMGVTICCASGDNGYTDGESDGTPNVDFPASAPHALGCGGTKIELDASGSAIGHETVWNAGADSATGGGFSAIFPLPPYQSGLPAGKSTRGVPDVAGNADPASGYAVRVDGNDFVIGGTSAVAPLWAGLIALMNQKLGRSVGFINPLLYGPLKGKVTTDITQGDNGPVSDGGQAAGPGWDACTGWGSPNGEKLLQELLANGKSAAMQGKP